MPRHPYEDELERAGVDPRLRKIAHEYFKGDRIANWVLSAIIFISFGVCAVIVALWLFTQR